MKTTCLKNIYLRIGLSIFILISAINSVVAQTDSLAVVDASWKVQKIAPGVWLKQAWFNQSLFRSNQNISILEIRMNRRNRIDVAAEPQELKTTSTFGAEHQALAAVNGTFFDMKNGGSVDYIRIDGKVLNESRTGKDGQRKFNQKSAVVTNRHKLSIASWDGSNDWESKLKGEDVMVSGPLLLKNKALAQIDSSGFCTNRHPRTAVAVKGKMVLLITVDGRNNKAAGMSLFELARLLKWLGANDAVNLDGGGSTTLWVSGFPDGGVINHPSDNNVLKNSKDYKPGTDLDNLAADVTKWDHSGERRVANVLLVNEKK